MQTFLPYADYAKSVQVLDPSRLGNQVYREGLTLLRGGWPNHPASKMWRGHLHHLALYCLAGLEELTKRGKDYPHHYDEVHVHLFNHPDTGPPPWLGSEEFHASHRSNLLRKNPTWYGKFGWTEPDNLPYVWPINTKSPSPPKPKRFKLGKKL